MADINGLVPLIFKWEGGFVNDPQDRGGPTNMGVTLKTWQMLGRDKNQDGKNDLEDLKMITPDEVVELVLKPYWDRWKADHIINQAIANILVDWVWASGRYGIVIPQRILGVKQDGIVGNITLGAVNLYVDQKKLFDTIKGARIAYIDDICIARPANNRYKKGWMNRLNDFRFY